MISLALLTQYIRQLWQPRSGLAIAEASVIGIVAALSAVLLKEAVGWLGTWRVHSTHILPAWLILPMIATSLGFFAGWLVQRFAPEAVGSGIPQVKATLANVPLKLSWRVAIVKLIATIITLGSGLTLGRQGPTVQIGASLAAGMSRLVPTSPEHRRQMIAAGAGAGLAAAFNAPLAGVLFIIEELLQDLSGLTLGTAIIAAFIGGVISRWLSGRSLQLDLQLINYSTSFSLLEIPGFLILGIFAGILAALFTKGLIFTIKIYQQLHISLPLKVALAGFISSIFIALLPESFRDNAGLREYMIASEHNISLAAIAFIAQFILTLIAFGSGAPGGLFAPSLILGSCLGHIIGVTQFIIFDIGSPITYTLAGMGGFFSAVSKVPITAIVIIFEMTTDFNLVLPLMIVCVTSYLVAEKIVPGSLYTKLLNLKGITLEKNDAMVGLLSQLTADNVMQKQVQTLNCDLTLADVMQVFYRSHHHGFPVVENNQLVGLICQSDLQRVRRNFTPENTLLKNIMTTQPITVKPEDKLTHVLYLLNRYHISHLPVIDGKKLIGIITYADIIKAEADHINGENNSNQKITGFINEPSYIVYQTRSPSIGKGRILVTLANPETAENLLEIAVNIASDRHYEIECLQVILVSRYTSPSESAVKTAKSRRLLRKAESLAKRFNIPIHTQIRVSHDLTQAILETINERHINLILMGWKGNTSTPGRIFGNVVDMIIHQAMCDVILVKFGDNFQSLQQTKRWLVPMSGGPNAPLAVNLLPSLITASSDTENMEICLIQIYKPFINNPDTTVLETAISQLLCYPQLENAVIYQCLQADSVVEEIINLVNIENYEIVILGASCEGLLQQTIQGNIPEAIASSVDSTVILVRGKMRDNMV
ncbi:chloride channel protein [Anabaena sp. FACHB-1237]|uniref:chloride channel protein n=1 Tax=Anabaena sp. FACHB-1237 TaxID=2692769 RepID=UPI001680B8EF|nr:chloride channel protein [Anabaena sp. FACHB-1237]MBD2138926.1 chloride channel protein [Anabaena sp. FACHB-1237]